MTESFVRIAQLRSIRSAARDLGVTPAGASDAKLAPLEVARRSAPASNDAAGDLNRDGLASAACRARCFRSRSRQAALGSVEGRAARHAAGPGSFARVHIVPSPPDFRSRCPDLAIDLRISNSIVDSSKAPWMWRFAVPSSATHLSSLGG